MEQMTLDQTVFLSQSAIPHTTELLPYKASKLNDMTHVRISSEWFQLSMCLSSQRPIATLVFRKMWYLKCINTDLVKEVFDLDMFKSLAECRAAAGLARQ